MSIMAIYSCVVNDQYDNFLLYQPPFNLTCAIQENSVPCASDQECVDVSFKCNIFKLYIG